MDARLHDSVSYVLAIRANAAVADEVELAFHRVMSQAGPVSFRPDLAEPTKYRTVLRKQLMFD